MTNNQQEPKIIRRKWVGRVTGQDAREYLEVKYLLELPDGRRIIEYDWELLEEVPDEIAPTEPKREDCTNDHPDAEGLGYARFREGEVIGRVDEVNGYSAQTCQSFVPTRHELRLLAKHWLREQLDMEYFWFTSQCVGSSEWRIVEYAGRRFQRIAEILDHDDIETIRDKVDSELSERFGQEPWEAFIQARA